MELINTRDREWWIKIAFDIGMIFKGINGLLELLAATLLIVYHAQLDAAMRFFVSQELVQGPPNTLARIIVSQFGHLLNVRGFLIAYFLVHGGVKIFLVWQLLTEHRKMYPVAIGVFALFLAYEIVRLTVHPSITLLVLCAIDVLILWLIWHEYKIHRRKRKTAA